jgi:cellulose synthase/poly-beta-1,6-N-acetylglucosamine synthase-like glycosyltransferase
MFLNHWRAIVFVAFCIVVFIQVFYYLYFFLRLAFQRSKELRQTQQHPVTVVVCARDEANNLVKNLPGVLLQTYPTTNEVIVVNDNSYDESRFLLNELKKTFKHLHVVELSQEAIGIPGKKFPLSMGIKTAKHEVLLLTDADCVPGTEFWMQTMQAAYNGPVEIVLGYGAYKKLPGLLNKLIRFETFHTALQYMSFALAGLPYMGVGRNLSYKRDVFFRNKGFSALNHVSSGDDDLFINMVANKNNVAVVTDVSAHTVSEPKKTFNGWWHQKARHYTTAKYYKPVHKLLLGLYSFSLFLMVPLTIVACLFVKPWWLPLSIYGFRFLLQALVYYRTMRKLNEEDLFPLWWIWDLWQFFYYIIFSVTIFRRPIKRW